MKRSNRAVFLVPLLAVGFFSSCSTFGVVRERGRYTEKEISPSVDRAEIVNSSTPGPTGTYSNELIGRFHIILAANLENPRKKHVWEREYKALLEKMRQMARTEASDRGATHIEIRDVTTTGSRMEPYLRGPSWIYPNAPAAQRLKRRYKRPVTCYYPEIEVVLYRRTEKRAPDGG